MLIVLTGDRMTRDASEWLAGQGIAHRIIELPDSLGYKTHASYGLVIESRNNMDLPMRLSKERFIVMRVFREFDAATLPSVERAALVGEHATD